ncbi:MAG: PRC-barrel domain-containing protein [Planctomycetes bacterium]|nr:PRC-barrel domain-containing protein [Planctomycetota bacterium]
MLSNVLRSGSAAAFLLTAGVLIAQQPVPVQPAQPVRVEAQPGVGAVATYRAKQILGTKMMIQGNTAIGTVDDIVFDSAGNLEYLIVANDGKLVTVPWDATKFDLKSQSAVLNVTPEVYKTIPTYTATTYPDYWAPTYRTGVYKYYGLTPRELRRIERRNP